MRRRYTSSKGRSRCATAEKYCALFSKVHFSTRTASPHTLKNIGNDFRAGKWDLPMRKSILAAYTPPLRNKVRKPAGFPTPFRWAYPVLFCAVFECGHKSSAVRSEPEGRVFRLIYRKEYTVLFSIKRSTFSRAATYEGSQGECCGGGLHRGAKESAAAGNQRDKFRGDILW